MAWRVGAVPCACLCLQIRLPRRAIYEVNSGTGKRQPRWPGTGFALLQVTYRMQQLAQAELWYPSRISFWGWLLCCPTGGFPIIVLIGSLVAATSTKISAAPVHVCSCRWVSKIVKRCSGIINVYMFFFFWYFAHDGKVILPLNCVICKSSL